MVNLLPMGFGLPGLSVHNGLATSEVGFLFNLNKISKYIYKYYYKDANIDMSKKRKCRKMDHNVF